MNQVALKKKNKEKVNQVATANLICFSRDQ